ncbi:hypothetical protein ACEPPN_015517 [Leptodophora sp. 'Broadleaf-Isolate-01']
MQFKLSSLAVLCVTFAVGAKAAPTELTAAARDCNPNFYICNFSSLPPSIMVCDPTGHWKFAAKCDPGQDCQVFAGIPYCVG